MASTLQTHPESDVESTWHKASLPWYAPLAVIGAAAVLATAVGLLAGFNVAGIVVVAVLFYLIGIYVVARVVENARTATDRLVTGLVTTAFGLALLPLITLLYTVVENGAGVISAEFFSASMRNVIGEGGGIYHAVWGTLVITGMATLMSVPIGVFAAIYLVEYGTGALARWITFLVDVMTGIPSIVAGLFAYALFAIFLGPGIRSGLGGAVALSVLMIPIVVRATEEMLKLVPNELREAAYALGVPRWRTIIGVVLRTASAGIATGVTLAIARVIGETAPLLVIAGATDSVNFNPIEGRMQTLPVFTFSSFSEPGIPPEFSFERAWGAALTLIVIVLVLNLMARFISDRFSPSAGR